MMKLFYLILLIFANSSYAHTADSLFFDTTFLSNYSVINKILQEEENFKEVWFYSTDGIKLNGLFGYNPNAPYTIIFCAGFYPGRKEGLASFIKMVPPECNILFFDARGHGNSYGSFFSSIYRYGKNEYKDILGAIQFVYAQAPNPIFIHAICAGTYHAIQALSDEQISAYPIKGFICDSGLLSLVNSCHVPRIHFCQKIIPRFLLSWYKNDSKQEIKERYLCKILCGISHSFFTIATYIVKPFLKNNEETINLHETIKKISCPIFFIHSYDDTYAPIESIQKISECISQKTCWWLEKSEHALHHIKHRELYIQKLLDFIYQARCV